MVVEVELLVGGWTSGLGGDETLQIGEGEVGGEIESQKLLVEWMVRSNDGDSNARPVAPQLVTVFVEINAMEFAVNIVPW